MPWWRMLMRHTWQVHAALNCPQQHTCPCKLTITIWDHLIPAPPPLSLPAAASVDAEGRRKAVHLRGEGTFLQQVCLPVAFIM